MNSSFFSDFVNELIKPETLEKLIYLLGIFLSALMVYKLGALAYKNQKNYEEIRDFYLKGGLELLQQEISSCIETVYYNHEVLQRELRYIRVLKPESAISFEDIKIELKEYFPAGFAFRSMSSVKYLLDDDIFIQRIITFFGYFRATLILFDEINLTIKKTIENPKEWIPNKKEKLKLYKKLKRELDERIEEISKHFFILDLIIGLINLIRDKFHFYTSIKHLSEKLKKAPEVQKILSTALWQPVINNMKDKGTSITEFMGIYSDNKDYQEKKLKKWDKFKILLDNNYIIPCSYEESTGSPEQKGSGLKWKSLLSERYKQSYSEAYKFRELDDTKLEKVNEILLK